MQEIRLNNFLRAVLIVLGMLGMRTAYAQQPQTQPSPIYNVNAAYVNGVAPGYWVTSGSGLTLNVGGGTAFCGGAIRQYAAGTLTLASSSTNYVYLNTTSACAPATKTTGFVAADIPVAIVTTGASAITAVSDVRTPFFTASAGVSVPGTDRQVIYNNNGAMGATAGFTFDGTNLAAPGIATGYSGRAQIAAGGSGGYSNFTLNGNNTDGGRIGFIGGGGADPNLYLDALVGGGFHFRANNADIGIMTATGLQVTSLTCTSSPCGAALTVPGANQQVLYNSNGALGAVAGFKFDGTTLTIPSFAAGASTIATAFPLEGADHNSMAYTNTAGGLITMMAAGGTVAGAGSKIVLGDGTHPGFVDFNSYASMGYSPASNAFLWTTNNNGAGGFIERLRLLNNGDFGIGLGGANPTHLLDIGTGAYVDNSGNGHLHSLACDTGQQCGSGAASAQGAQYDLQLAGTAGALAAQSGMLRSDAEGKGNLYTGVIENDVTNPTWAHHLAAGYTNFFEYRDANTIFNGGANSDGIPQTRGRWSNYTFTGIGHIWTLSQNIGASTQIGDEVDYNSYTAGQNIGSTGTLSFLGDGDNISSERQMLSGGNALQANQEATHGDWLDIRSQGNATANCGGGCGQNGSVAIIPGFGTGQGTLIADRTDNQHGNIVTYVGNTGNSQPFSEVQVSGFTLGTSTRFQINERMTVDQKVTAPCCGPWALTGVTVSINTTPVYTGAAASTSGIAASGFGCLVNPPTWTGMSTEIVNLEMYERVAYTVVDATHLTVYPGKVHSANSEFFVGGACGYGIEQSAQTDGQHGAMTVYPLAGSFDDSHVIYVGNGGMALGSSGSHNFENASCSVTSIARSGTTNTVTLSGCSGIIGSLNQQKVTIAGITTDTSFNASNVTLTATADGSTWTYPSGTSGTVATTTVAAGALTAGNTGAYIYPVAEVEIPHNPDIPKDGSLVMTTPFTFPTANAVLTRSLPYYSQFNGDLVQVHPTEDTVLGSYGHHIILSGGTARGATGSGQYGYWAENDEPCSAYQNCGGTYLPPDAAFYTSGSFRTGLYMYNPPMDGNGSVLFVNDSGNWWPNGSQGGYYNMFLTGSGMGLGVTKGLSGSPESKYLNLFAPNVTIGSSTTNGITVYSSYAGPWGGGDDSLNTTFSVIKPAGDMPHPSLTVYTDKNGTGSNIALQVVGTANVTGPLTLGSTVSSGLTGPADASGCAVVGWTFYSDGHAGYCDGSVYHQKF